MKVRANPTYTIHGVNALARSLWVEHIMSNPGKDVMAVQTLRNFIMGSSLMASTAALLIIGTLTLSGQAQNISQSWHVLSGHGSYATELWIIKVMFLLFDFIVAFFAFAMSVRLANHVVFMVNVPDHDAHHNLSPQAVARRLQRSGNMFAIGMRAFFFAVPLAFWTGLSAGVVDWPGRRAVSPRPQRAGRCTHRQRPASRNSAGFGRVNQIGGTDRRRAEARAGQLARNRGVDDRPARVKLTVRRLAVC